jgi:K+/H+ antiporter YhaU regulatory subunit KhtT
MEQNLTSEEIQALKDLQEKTKELTKKFGEVEMQIQTLKLVKTNLDNQFQKLKSIEKEIGEHLSKKYGDGQIFLDLGKVVTPD